MGFNSIAIFSSVFFSARLDDIYCLTAHNTTWNWVTGLLHWTILRQLQLRVHSARYKYSRHSVLNSSVHRAKENWRIYSFSKKDKAVNNLTNAANKKYYSGIPIHFSLRVFFFSRVFCCCNLGERLKLLLNWAISLKISLTPFQFSKKIPLLTL